MPYSLSELKDIAAHAESSGLFGGGQKLTQSQALMRMLRGQELGLTPLVALGGIWFSRGKLICDAGTTALLLANHGYTVDDLESTNEKCTMQLAREGHPVGRPITFSMDDARQAGLVKGEGAWKSWPADMLWARCLTRLARRYAAHVFGGSVYAPGEMAEEPPDEHFAVPQMMTATPVPEEAAPAITPSSAQAEALAALRTIAHERLGLSRDVIKEELLKFAGKKRLLDIPADVIRQYIVERYEGQWALAQEIMARPELVPALEALTRECGCLGAIPFERLMDVYARQDNAARQDGNAAADELFGTTTGLVVPEQDDIPY